ncbi:YtpI family protein [Ectobacillus ponti]|uniref:YtpI family protein n=1 Tax=Ectobacillus ponti TaxID=2961894 RepID=A0AA41X2J1_9BACI|nr:YtpI family protein [Ectobacillus ponti]MCP8967442.1 YtpI family protein [Ectobacillus ponti]
MLIFTVLTLVSLMLYLFYKTKQIRCQRPAEKAWLAGKCAVALGSFVAFFGLNLFFVLNSTVSMIVGIVFLAIGAASAWNGIRQYKYFLPLAIEEAEKL